MACDVGMSMDTFSRNIISYLKYLSQVVMGEKHSFKVDDVKADSSNGFEFCDVYYHKINDKTRYSIRIVFYGDHAAIVHGRLEIVDVRSDVELLRALERSKFQDKRCLDVVHPATGIVTTDFSWDLCTLLMWIDNDSERNHAYWKSSVAGMDYEFYLSKRGSRAKGKVYSCLDLLVTRPTEPIYLDGITDYATKTGVGACFIEYEFQYETYHLKLAKQDNLIRAACCVIVEDAFGTLEQLDAFLKANVYCVVEPRKIITRDVGNPFD